MNIDHIFESGPTFSSTVGWALFFIGAWLFGIWAPYGYDAWLIRRWKRRGVKDPERSRQLRAATERLTEHHERVSQFSRLDRIVPLDRFGRQAMTISVIFLLCMIAGILFPSLLKMIFWVIMHTM